MTTTDTPWEEPQVERPVIDMRCMCEKCQARTQETYRLAATCTNCRTECVALIRKGDKPTPSKDCPACGVSWQWLFAGLVTESGSYVRAGGEG